ncbi:melanocortin-2 receptor accessory protein [Aptenodytes patagonicus]|uniref:melanocortin-2 receptor accessory protein n=1 Tax=Aptenodytes patagonicus TaxID=9234 RepID=UPI003FA0BB48
MANRTNSSEYFWSYEYYWDYIDPIPVDGSKLKVNKYSIVIAFWVGLAAFVTFLFLILLYMSRSGSTPVKSGFRLKLLSQLRGAKGVLPVEWFSLRPIWLRAVLLLQQEAYASYAPSPAKSSVLLT